MQGTAAITEIQCNLTGPNLHLIGGIYDCCEIKTSSRLQTLVCIQDFTYMKRICFNETCTGTYLIKLRT